MNYKQPIKTIQEEIRATLEHSFQIDFDHASRQEIYKAVVTIVRLLDVGDQAGVRVLLGHVIPGVEGLDVTVIEYQ
jgi:hypothetical protein